MKMFKSDCNLALGNSLKFNQIFYGNMKNAHSSELLWKFRILHSTFEWLNFYKQIKCCVLRSQHRKIIMVEKNKLKFTLYLSNRSRLSHQSRKNWKIMILLKSAKYFHYSPKLIKTLSETILNALHNKDPKCWPFEMVSRIKIVISGEMCALSLSLSRNFMWLLTKIMLYYIECFALKWWFVHLFLENFPRCAALSHPSGGSRKTRTLYVIYINRFEQQRKQKKKHTQKKIRKFFVKNVWNWIVKS